MKIAFVLFDRMTTLDFVGFYEPMTRLYIHNLMEPVSWDLCAMREEVTDELGIVMKAHKIEPDLSAYDMVFVPGGLGTRQLRFDSDFVDWLRSSAEAEYKVSVCTGALLLGAAGFLQGKRATTNPPAYELLAPYCEEVVRTRIVRDGDVITGGGVAAAVDLGLYVVECLAGPDAANLVQRAMDYPYYQPGKAGGDYSAVEEAPGR